MPSARAAGRARRARGLMRAAAHRGSGRPSRCFGESSPRALDPQAQGQEAPVSSGSRQAAVDHHALNFQSNGSGASASNVRTAGLPLLADSPSSRSSGSARRSRLSDRSRHRPWPARGHSPFTRPALFRRISAASFYCTTDIDPDRRYLWLVPSHRSRCGLRLPLAQG
jgi:hypothetical protein